MAGASSSTCAMPMSAYDSATKRNTATLMSRRSLFRGAFSASTTPLAASSSTFRRRHCASPSTLAFSNASTPIKLGGYRATSTQLRAFADSSSSAGSSSSSSSSSLQPSTSKYSTTVGEDPVAAAAARHARLQLLIQLRKLYRNLLRAEPLLEFPSPVYQPLSAAELQEQAVTSSRDSADGDASTSGQNMDDLDAAALAEEEQRRIDEAVEIVAEMELSAEELRAGLRVLRSGTLSFGSIFKSAGAGEEAEKSIEQRVKAVYADLVERAKLEIGNLPFATRTLAQAAIDARNARYRTSVAWLPTDGYISDGDIGTAVLQNEQQRRGLTERLTEAERVAEQFLSRRLQPAVKKVRETSPEGVLEGLKISATYVRGVWNRLNGARPDGGDGTAPSGLPLPESTETNRNKALDRLHDDIEELERKLQEASKARETRLRKAGIQGRARMASELRAMDNEVAGLSRALAVRTLQLEAEFVFGALEGEALDVLGDPNAAGGDRGLALSRRGSSDEVALLAAEFRLLDEQLATLVAEVESGDALFIDDLELAKLATDLPDMRVRLGVNESEVFGGTGVSLSKLQQQVKQSVMKVMDGVSFGVRGVRLLGSDVGSAGTLFWRALIGGTLKPREVQAIRRTARDLLTFIPFTIILILPLTPVGHVLIFGFIQRYFPGFFPSQFSSKRQELMIKYEQLKQQLQEAELSAELESEEMEFQRAAAYAALAIEQRKTQAATVQIQQQLAAAVENSRELEAAAAAAGDSSRGSSGGSSDGGDGVSSTLVALATDPDGEEGPAARAVKKLEEELAAAADDSYTGASDDDDIDDGGKEKSKLTTH